MAVNVATDPAQKMPTAPSKSPRRTQRVAYVYLAPVIFSAIVFTILPFVYTAYFAFTNYSFIRVTDYRWVGFQNFRDAIAGANGFLPVLGWTAAWMILSTIFNVGAGMLLALMLNHPRLTERNVYRTLLVIPWALPFILTVQVWAGIFNTQGPLNLILTSLGTPRIRWLQDVTPARTALLITNLWLSYPFFMTVCLAALQSIPRDLYEVAELDGAGGWDRFKAITVPFMIAAITPLIITQLSFQFGNAGVIILLTNGLPLGFQGAQYGLTDTLASYAYKLVFSQRLYGLAAAYSIVMFLVVAAFTIINSTVTGAFKERDV